LSRDGLIDWLRSVNGTPEAVLQSREMMDMVLPALRADLHMDDNYRSGPDPALACPLTALAGTHDQEVAPEELQAWSTYTSQTFIFRQIEGDHFFPFGRGQANSLQAISEVLLG